MWKKLGEKSGAWKRKRDEEVAFQVPATVAVGEPSNVFKRRHISFTFTVVHISVGSPTNQRTNEHTNPRP